jgi:hypothetical protein
MLNGAIPSRQAQQMQAALCWLVATFEGSRSPGGGLLPFGLPLTFAAPHSKSIALHAAVVPTIATRLRGALTPAGPFSYMTAG